VRSRATRRSAAAVLALLLPLPGGSGPGAAEEPPKSGLREEVSVRLVQMPILATDRQGRPILDLKEDEIVVQYRGEKMKVAYLEPARPTEEEQRTYDAKLYLDAPGGFDVPVSSAGLRSSYVIFFVDVDNDDPLRKDAALDSMLSFFQQSMEPGTRVAVVSFDGEVHLDLTFTEDRTAIAGALRQAWARRGQPKLDLRGQVRQFLGLLDQCLQSTDQFDRARGDQGCIEQRATEYAEQLRPRSAAFLTALTQTVRVAGGLHGKKSVVAVSHGIAADPATEILEAVRALYGPGDTVTNLQLHLGFGGTPKAKLDELLKLALRNKVTMHFVDRTRPPSSDIDASRGHPLQPGTRPVEVAYTAAQEDLKEIAGSTGGIFVSSPDLTTGLASVRSAQSGSYELGFYVGDAIPSASLVKFDVDATRKGVRIAHRRGFFASSPAEDLAVKGTIVLGPPMPREAGHAGAKHSFRLLVDPRTIGYASTGAEYSANLTLHFLVSTFDGKEVVDSFHFLHHAYPADIWKGGTMKPIVVGGWTELPPGAFLLTAWIRNVDTGREGQITNAVEVEASPSAALPSSP
jgi:VWFA-related protein